MKLLNQRKVHDVFRLWCFTIILFLNTKVYSYDRITNSRYHHDHYNLNRNDENDMFHGDEEEDSNIQVEHNFESSQSEKVIAEHNTGNEYL